MSREIYVKKVSIDGAAAVKIEFEETITSTHNGEETSTINDFSGVLRNKPHADFVAAIESLAPHVVQLCELSDVPSLVDIPDRLLRSIEVSGITIGGSGEHEGVVIIAKKRLKHRRVVNLITPFVKWEDEHCGYDYAGALSSCVSVVIDEAKQYLNGKYAPNPQMEIVFDEQR